MLPEEASTTKQQKEQRHKKNWYHQSFPRYTPKTFIACLPTSIQEL